MGRQSRQVWEYDSMAEFEAAGGAAGYGDGAVLIGKKLCVVKDHSLINDNLESILSDDISPGVTIDSCSALTGWTVSASGTVSVDSTVNFKGANTLKLTAGAGGANAAHITKTIAVNLAETDTVGFWIYIASYADLLAIRSNFGSSYVQLYLSENSGFTNTFTLNALGGSWIPTSNVHAVGWNYVQWRIGEAGVSGGPSLNYANQIIRARIYVSHPVGLSVNVGPIVLGAKRKPVVLFGFDDGYQDAYANGYRYLDKLGLRGYLAIPKQLVGAAGGYTTLRQITDMYDRGWDIVNHSYSHISLASLAAGAATTQPALGVATQALENTAMWQVEMERDWLWRCGFRRAIDCLVYPIGEFNDSLIAQLKAAGFIWARAAHWGRQNFAGGFVDRAFLLNSPSILCDVSTGSASLNTWQKAIAQVDKSIACNGCWSGYAHRVNDAPTIGNWDTYNFQAFARELADRASDGLVDVLTPSEFVSRTVHVDHYAF